MSFIAGYLLGLSENDENSLDEQQVTFTENGVYSPADNVRWTSVTVSVGGSAQCRTMPLSVTGNKTYYAADYGVDGFDPVNGSALYAKAIKDYKNMLSGTGEDTPSENGEITFPGGAVTGLSREDAMDILSGPAILEGKTVTDTSSGYYLRIIYDSDPGSYQAFGVYISNIYNGRDTELYGFLSGVADSVAVTGLSVNGEGQCVLHFTETVNGTAYLHTETVNMPPVFGAGDRYAVGNVPVVNSL